MALVVVVRRERDPCELGHGAPSFSLVTLGDFQHGAPGLKVVHVAGNGTRLAGAPAPVFRCARCGRHVAFSYTKHGCLSAGVNGHQISKLRQCPLPRLVESRGQRVKGLKDAELKMATENVTEIAKGRRHL